MMVALTHNRNNIMVPLSESNAYDRSILVG